MQRRVGDARRLRVSLRVLRTSTKLTTVPCRRTPATSTDLLNLINHLSMKSASGKSHQNARQSILAVSSTFKTRLPTSCKKYIRWVIYSYQMQKRPCCYSSKQYEHTLQQGRNPPEHLSRVEPCPLQSLEPLHQVDRYSVASLWVYDGMLHTFGTEGLSCFALNEWGRLTYTKCGDRQPYHPSVRLLLKPAAARSTCWLYLPLLQESSNSRPWCFAKFHREHLRHPSCQTSINA